MNDTNWAKRPTSTVSDSDKKALAEAKKQERKQIKDGYRWFSITDKLKVLVPCNKDGKPTAKGQRLLLSFAKRFSVKV